MTPIETGDIYGEDTAVLKGLSPGTDVAVDPLQSLRQNLVVNPRMGGEVTSIANEPAQGEARQ